MTEVRLSAKEIRMLLQSLANCLDTCKVHAKNPSARCEDCDAARKLQGKLKKQLAS